MRPPAVPARWRRVAATGRHPPIRNAWTIPPCWRAPLRESLSGRAAPRSVRSPTSRASFDAFSTGEAGCAESMPAPSVGASSRSTSCHRHAGLSSPRGTRLRPFSCSVVTVPVRRRPACHFTVTTVSSPETSTTRPRVQLTHSRRWTSSPTWKIVIAAHRLLTRAPARLRWPGRNRNAGRA
jgi:hypothetical protein